MELAEPRTGKGAQASLRGTAVPQRDVLRGRARGATTEVTRAGAREEAQQQERAASEGQRREPRTHATRGSCLRGPKVRALELQYLGWGRSLSSGEPWCPQPRGQGSTVTQRGHEEPSSTYRTSL